MLSLRKVLGSINTEKELAGEVEKGILNLIEFDQNGIHWMQFSSGIGIRRQ